MSMTDRERMLAVMRYQKYDRLPIVHFGFWPETLDKWVAEGHLKMTQAERAQALVDGSDEDRQLGQFLGFDFNWYTTLQDNAGFGSLLPKFEKQIVAELEDGITHRLNDMGVVILQKEGATGIPPEIKHTLVDRTSWEAEYLPRLKWGAERINHAAIDKYRKMADARDYPLGVYCGSLFGQIRDWLGIEGVSYLYADDEDLYDEIINAVGILCLHSVESMLDCGVKFDFAHFWEDICFKNGPLVTPSVFEEKVGPWYKKITDACRARGIDLVSLDCDGCIDALVPIFFENGVNAMFPIEVGTWDADIRPWREQFGRELRGVGGMRKHVLAQDRPAIDREIDRLKALVELGGYIPCPDHRISPDAKWDNVLYYCEAMRKIFS